MSHLFPTGENKSWTNHQNERPLSIWMKKTWKPSRDSRRNTTSQSIGLSISVFRDTSQRWLSGFEKMNQENDGVMVGDSLLCPDIESLKSLFNDWLDDCVGKGIPKDTKIPSTVTDNKLHFTFRDVVLTRPEEDNTSDLHIEIERVGKRKWKDFRNMNWQCWLRKISQRMKGNWKRRLRNCWVRVLSWGR